MFKFLKQQLIKPSLAEIAGQELEAAKRALLEAQTQQDIAFSAVIFHENRITRLERFIQTGQLIDHDEQPEFNVH